MLDPKLDTLLLVAEKRNFTRAAQALSLTQPAVSHHISQLEQELGVRLFVRGNGDLMLTPEGETVLRYVRRMKALEKKMADPHRHNAYVREQSHRRGARSVQQPAGQIEDNPFYGYHK